MNTTTTRLATRTAAAAACLAALIAGATACGTEDGTASARPATAHQPNSAKANEAQYLQQLKAKAEAARQARAEKADAGRWARGYPGATTPSPGFGDDRRQAIDESRDSSTHAPGYNKAMPGQY